MNLKTRIAYIKANGETTKTSRCTLFHVLHSAQCTYIGKIVSNSLNIVISTKLNFHVNGKRFPITSHGYICTILLQITLYT